MNFNSTRRAEDDWLEKKAPHFQLKEAGYPAFGHLTESEKIVKKLKDQQKMKGILDTQVKTKVKKAKELKVVEQREFNKNAEELLAKEKREKEE